MKKIIIYMFKNGTEIPYEFYCPDDAIIECNVDGEYNYYKITMPDNNGLTLVLSLYQHEVEIMTLGVDGMKRWLRLERNECKRIVDLSYCEKVHACMLPKEIQYLSFDAIGMLSVWWDPGVIQNNIPKSDEIDYLRAIYNHSRVQSFISYALSGLDAQISGIQNFVLEHPALSYVRSGVARSEIQTLVNNVFDNEQIASVACDLPSEITSKTMYRKNNVK